MIRFHVQPPRDSLLLCWLVIYNFLPINFCFNIFAFCWIPDIHRTTRFWRYRLTHAFGLSPDLGLPSDIRDSVIDFSSCVIYSCNTIHDFDQPVAAIILLLLLDFHCYYSLQLDRSFSLFNFCELVCFICKGRCSWYSLLLLPCCSWPGQSGFWFFHWIQICSFFSRASTITFLPLNLSIDLHYRAFILFHNSTSSSFVFLFSLFG